jgi:SulP family sulfate permease
MERKKRGAKGFAGDAVGGFVAGLYSVPEGIGYAQLAGLNPMLGIYSGMVPVAVSAATTGSVLMMSTLTSAIALTTGGVLTAAGYSSSQFPQAVFTLALLSGVIMTVLGLLRWGKVVNFVSNAVMTGFVMGVAVLITVGKFDDIFGYKPSGISNKVVEALDIVVHPGDWNLTTTAVGVGTILLAFALKSIRRFERMALVASVAIGTAVVWIFSIPTELISDVAEIPSGLSALPIPDGSSTLPDLSMVPTLMAGSVSIALVALAQGAGIRPAFPNPDGLPASSSRDFLGQGLGNIAGAFFQSTPTGGSLSRTAVSADGGASSRKAGFVAAATVVLLVVLLAPLVGRIPEAVIGGLLFVIGVELVVGRVPDARLAWRTGTAPRLLFFVTLVMTLTIPLQWAILGGALLSLFAYVGESSRRGLVRVVSQDEQGWRIDGASSAELPEDTVVTLWYDGPSFFAEVPSITEQLPRPAPGQAPSVVVINCVLLHNLSSTMVKSLLGYHRDLRSEGCGLVLTGVEAGQRQILRDTGLLDEVGDANVIEADSHIGANVERGHGRGTALLAELRAQRAAATQT